MRVALWAAVVLAACSVTQPAWSNGGGDTSGGRVASNPTVNLIGAGPSVGDRITDNFRIRFDAGFAVGSKRAGDPQGNLRKRFSSSMIDYYPLGDGFRISLGGRVDNASKGVRSAASLANNLLYAPKSSRAVSRGNGFKRFAPAATVGFGEMIGRNMTVGIVAGALMVRGNPATREFVRFARMGTDDNRFRMGGSRINPAMQASFALKF